MKRNTFIQRLGLGTGAAVLLPTASFLQACETAYIPQIRENITQTDMPMLNAIAETILPASETSPGAASAGVGDYILLMYKDCMSMVDKNIVLSGLNQLDALCAERYKNSFSRIEKKQQLELLTELQEDTIAFDLAQENKTEPVAHYFGILKGLTISGYFSSEVGITQARAYLPLPGKYEACISYQQGDKPWAI